MFCVACGDETSDLTEGGLCRDCFLEKLAVVRLPDRVDVEICVHCGSRKRGELWLAPARPPGDASFSPEDVLDETARIVRETAIDRVTVDRAVSSPTFAATARMQDQHGKMWETVVRATGRAEGFEAAGEASTVVRVKGGTCLRCSRRQGGYYEAILQLRALRRDLRPDELASTRRIASRLIDKIVSEGDANAFVLRDVEEDGGLDIYFGTTNAARMTAKAIANELGGRTTEHGKLVGQRDGVDLYRMTFAIRIPEYRKGDLLVLDDRPWVVASIGPKLVHLRNPATDSTQSVERDRLDRTLPTILDASSARDAVVVTRGARELDVVDPWTFATVTVSRPLGVPDDAESVPVVRFEGSLVVLPGVARAASRGPEKG